LLEKASKFDLYQLQFSTLPFSILLYTFAHCTIDTMPFDESALYSWHCLQGGLGKGASGCPVAALQRHPMAGLENRAAPRKRSAYRDGGELGPLPPLSAALATPGKGPLAPL
jgi:hypothetical protein